VHLFLNMKAGTKSTLATHNEPSNGPAVVPTPSQGPKHVQQVIYFKISHVVEQILRITKW
jgi:hypothetical protein